MLLAALSLQAALALAEDEPLELGQRLELFVDEHLIESLDGARLELCVPRDEGSVLRFDRPWEGAFSGYATVLQDGERFLLYYRGLPQAGGDGTAQEVCCVALSEDGVVWRRPELGIYEVAGTRANNVVLAEAAPVTHNFAPFLDTRPGVAPSERFKALGGGERSGLIAYASPDGLHWERMRAQPVLTGAPFDSQNVAFWSQHEGRYLCYFRTWTGGGYQGYRSVSRASSDDFLAWGEHEPMSFGDGPPEHIYTNQTTPYFRAPQLYIGIAARFFPGRQVLTPQDAGRLGVDPGYFRDCSDAVLLSSRGGASYERRFLEAFLRPGIGLENWGSRSNYPARGILRTGPSEMSIYVNQNYAQESAELVRYSLRLDGLASVRAGRAGGELVTKSLRFTGDELLLNFASSAAGGLRVEFTDAEGVPLPGYALDDCVEQIGNELERAVSWRRPDGTSTALGELAGRVVRMRIQLVDADLYALRFRAR